MFFNNMFLIILNVFVLLKYRNMQTIKKLYFDPKTGFISKDKLYKKAKQVDNTITHALVNEFYKSNATHQIFKRQPVKNYFPIHYQADIPFQRMQIDLMDVSREIPSRNGGVKFIWVCIDVYIRFAICVL